MKTYILVYDTFAQFEVVLAAYFLKTKGDIITVGITKDTVLSAEGFTVLPDMVLSDVINHDIDVFIIPGGDPNILFNETALSDMLKQISKKATLIGAVCSGSVHFAKAGVLDEKRYTTSLDITRYDAFNQANYIDENVVIDKNIITAKANGYVDFAIELGKIMDIYESETDLNETIDFFKYFKY